MVSGWDKIKSYNAQLLLIDSKMLFREYPRIEMTLGKQKLNVNFKCTYEKVDRKNRIGVHALSRNIKTK